MIELTMVSWPSNNLATNAVCRAYDKGTITFKQWESCEIVCNGAGHWFITFPT